MRVFVLSPGRSASTTIYKAFSHATNYTVGHESNWGKIDDRLDYPDNHIEIDNRLLWFHRWLDYPEEETITISLYRNREDVVNSFAGRFTHAGIMTAYAILQGLNPNALTEEQRFRVAASYVDWATNEIELMNCDIGISVDVEFEFMFREVWRLIGATGDVDVAARELDIRHNQTPVKDD